MPQVVVAAIDPRTFDAKQTYKQEVEHIREFLTRRSLQRHSLHQRVSRRMRTGYGNVSRISAVFGRHVAREEPEAQTIIRHRARQQRSNNAPHKLVEDVDCAHGAAKHGGRL